MPARATPSSHPIDAQPGARLTPRHRDPAANETRQARRDHHAVLLYPRALVSTATQQEEEARVGNGCEDSVHSAGYRVGSACPAADQSGRENHTDQQGR